MVIDIMLMADFDDYLECQSKIENLYANNNLSGLRNLSLIQQAWVNFPLIELFRNAEDIWKSIIW